MPSSLIKCVLTAAIVFILGLLQVMAESPVFFDFTLNDITGQEVNLGSFRESPVILVVNVASQCGYTDSNYRQLQAMYEEFKPQGLEILAFPCNQFGKQEPGTPEDILSFAKNNYGVTFPLFEKVEVNGAAAHPLFEHLKAATGGAVQWNFSKFLVVNGQPVRAFSHGDEPTAVIRPVVEELLEAAAAARGGGGEL
mmetsp:Transcript_26745/g.48621  ORF Transcript_26745/g.48621 Transcript_26745/m.48621 type:complete len:196 (+) Transcript_26745:16-603(+)